MGQAGVILIDLVRSRILQPDQLLYLGLPVLAEEASRDRQGQLPEIFKVSRREVSRTQDVMSAPHIVAIGQLALHHRGRTGIGRIILDPDLRRQWMWHVAVKVLQMLSRDSRIKHGPAYLPSPPAAAEAEWSEPPARHWPRRSDAAARPRPIESVRWPGRRPPDSPLWAGWPPGGS